MVQYNSWPIGKLPQEFRRSEPEMIREKYQWDDARDIVSIFENKVAEFAGAKYAISVDCCSHAIFLSLKYLMHSLRLLPKDSIFIPTHTYCSVPMQIIHAGLIPKFYDISWRGAYQLIRSCVWDAAVRWTKGMYIPDSLMCLSFQIKKRVPIGRGGMILTDDPDAAAWLKLASYDGRNLTTPYDSPEHISMVGWHMYMTPEDAARGILLMDQVPEENEDSAGWENYPDISAMFV